VHRDRSQVENILLMNSNQFSEVLSGPLAYKIDKKSTYKNIVYRSQALRWLIIIVRARALRNFIFYSHTNYSDHYIIRHTFFLPILKSLKTVRLQSL